MNIFTRVDESIGEQPGYEDEVFYEKEGFRITSIINTKPPYIPYFKVYYGTNKPWILRKESEDKMCRISLLEPKYLNLEGEDLVLNKEQKLRLIEILNSSYIHDPSETVWSQLLGLYNFFHKEFDIDQLLYDPEYKAPNFDPIDENATIPDYTKLGEV